MGARTGAQYIAGLQQMRREVWIGGERVEDVTTHPATRRGVQSYAHLYDMQHDPAIRDIMTYPSPTSGERVGTSFLMPRTPTDLALRREMMRQWANYSGGFLGRTPDYLNSAFMAMANASAYFTANDPRFGDNIKNYYEYIREHDLCLTHTLINPQANRAKGVSEQADPYLPAGVYAQDSDGIVIRGCRMLATSAPLADEIMVFPSTVVRNATDAERYAFAFSIATDTAGLKFVCRESLDQGKSHFDHPLTSRFEEMDAIVIFDDVLVPWERVFLLGDMDRCNNCFGATDAVVHMMHQVVIRDIAKAEFLLGVILMMIETVAIEQFQHVQEKAAEVITDLETMRAFLRAGEADAHLDAWGMMTPGRMPLDVGRNLFPKMYPRIKEIVQILGASGLMATATEADFAGPLAADVEKYLQAATVGGQERVRLYRLAWDIACSGFGGRQELYERYFFGDPVRMMSALYFGYDKDPLKQRIREFLHRDEAPIAPAPAEVTAGE
jgi:4-hydroxyphenylacetate 3-monooxygenase